MFRVATKFWSMVFATIHKFYGVISDVKMVHPCHLPIEVTPLRSGGAKDR